jgi:hypothetical protein
VGAKDANELPPSGGMVDGGEVGPPVSRGQKGKHKNTSKEKSLIDKAVRDTAKLLQADRMQVTTFSILENMPALPFPVTQTMVSQCLRWSYWAEPVGYIDGEWGNPIRIWRVRE